MTALKPVLALLLLLLSVLAVARGQGVLRQKLSGAAAAVDGSLLPETSLAVALTDEETLDHLAHNKFVLSSHVFTHVLPGLAMDYLTAYCLPFAVFFGLYSAYAAARFAEPPVRRRDWLFLFLAMGPLAVGRYLYGEFMAFALRWLPALVYEDRSFLPDTRVLHVDLMVPTFFAVAVAVSSTKEALEDAVYLWVTPFAVFVWMALTACHTSVPVLRHLSVLLYPAFGLALLNSAKYNPAFIPMALTAVLYGYCAGFNPGKGHLDYPSTAYRRFKPYDTPSLWTTIYEVGVGHFLLNSTIALAKTVVAPVALILLAGAFLDKKLPVPLEFSFYEIAAGLYVAYTYFYFLQNDALKFLARRNAPFLLHKNGSFLINPEFGPFRVEFYMVVVGFIELQYFARMPEKFEDVTMKFALKMQDIAETCIGKFVSIFSEYEFRFNAEMAGDIESAADNIAEEWHRFDPDLNVVKGVADAGALILRRLRKIIKALERGNLLRPLVIVAIVLGPRLQNFYVLAHFPTVLAILVIVAQMCFSLYYYNSTEWLDLSSESDLGLPVQLPLVLLNFILLAVFTMNDGVVSWCYYLRDAAGIQHVEEEAEEESEPEIIIYEIHEETVIEEHADGSAAPEVEEVGFGNSIIKSSPSNEAVSVEVIGAQDTETKSSNDLPGDSFVGTMSFALLSSLIVLF